jgi:uncharacterized protein DUF6580
MNRNEKEVSMGAKMVFVVAFILLAAALRVAPHPWNLTPIGAMAIFSGAMLRSRWMKFAVPLAALFVGDIFAGFHKLMPAVYASFLVSVAIGTWLEKRRSASRIAGITVLGAVQFFVVTNFAVWAAFSTYPKTAAGLAACYVAGIPFFWNTLAGDALYATLLFGGFALAEKIFPVLREPASQSSR